MTATTRLRVYILDHLRWYGGETFSTANIYLYLVTEHGRQAPTMQELDTLLRMMPDIQFIERQRWRYNPHGFTKDAEEMMRLVGEAGTVAESALQDRFGQVAVSDAVRNGTIAVTDGPEGRDASLTKLGRMRVSALGGRV